MQNKLLPTCSLICYSYKVIGLSVFLPNSKLELLPGNLIPGHFVGRATFLRTGNWVDVLSKETTWEKGGIIVVRGSRNTGLAEGGLAGFEP